GRRGVAAVPGALTPTEVAAAWAAGATAVKVFPVSAVGGPGYVKAVRAPLPEVPLVPTGGIGVDDIGAYLAAGAAAVGLGSPPLGDAGEPGGDPGHPTDRSSRAALAAPGIGRLRQVGSLTLGLPGAESNVAVGARRLGCSPAWVGRVGADELGE